MFGKILCLFVALAGIMGSSAFVPSTPLVRSRAAPGSSVVMSAKPQHAIAAATTALLTAAPAMAAEGTSLPFGIDNNLEVYIPLAVVVSINLIFFQWAGKQDGGDFFGEYDERRE